MIVFDFIGSELAIKAFAGINDAGELNIERDQEKIELAMSERHGFNLYLYESIIPANIDSPITLKFYAKNECGVDFALRGELTSIFYKQLFPKP